MLVPLTLIIFSGLVAFGADRLLEPDSDSAIGSLKSCLRKVGILEEDIGSVVFLLAPGPPTGGRDAATRPFFHRTPEAGLDLPAGSGYAGPSF
ncbi:MAG: hypothetical protein LBP95_10855 [Deltaproteobacteria bacterium]|jgi:hypothetical protein|nr:hypothetical protein [Deltaproteobacteria bacterium]